VTRVIGYLIGGLFLALALVAMGPRRSAYHRLATVPDWIWYGLIAMFVAAGVYIEVRRFRAAGRVRFDRVRPRIPVAVAREVPRTETQVPRTEAQVPRTEAQVPRTEAIEPLRTGAPEQVERAADEDGPRFLKDR
jgi:hypothetical protein